MIRRLIVLFLFLSFLFTLCGNALDRDGLARLDPVLRAGLMNDDGDASTQNAFYPLFDPDRFQITFSPLTGEPKIGVLVKTKGEVYGMSYKGIPVRGKAGRILSLAVSLAELYRLAEEDDVIYIEPAWRTSPKLDYSVPAIGVDSVHGADPPILGDGAIVGLVDTGIDYTHLDFRYDSDGDGFEESSRILAIWDQTWGLLGATYNKNDIEEDLALGYGPDAGTVRESDTDGHGTHVASIAAGDGSSSSYGFVGVAPGADIIVVKTTFYTSDILAGVEYIFDRAAALGRPAVVNLSLGGHDGPHDGTSLFEEGLDRLAAEPGRAIVVSAGNEGDDEIHASATLSGGASAFEVIPDDWEVELNVWYPGSSRFTMTVVSPSNIHTAAPTGIDTGAVLTADGIVYIDNASAGPNPNNGDNEAFIRLSNVAHGDRWRVVISDTDGGGRFDAWISAGSASLYGGDSSSTIDEPGNAQRVITVGAFTTKSSWPSQAGEQDFSSDYPIGEIAYFSSRGPTRDGRTKPDVTAPGAWICAARSTDAVAYAYLAHPDGQHMMEVGTSMAAPHVAGAIALLFSIDPDLSFTEIRGILTSTARAGHFTGAIPNDLWGWGKIAVAEAVGSVEPTEPVEPPAGEAPEISLVENPAQDEARFVYAVPGGTARATIRIYTVSGRLVFAADLPPDAGDYTWNLTSQRGERLAAGLYLYVLVTDRGASTVGRLVIER